MKMKTNGNGSRHLTTIITSVAATFIAGILLSIGVMIVRQTRTNTQDINNNFHRIEALEHAVFPGATPWPKSSSERD